MMKPTTRSTRARREFLAAGGALIASFAAMRPTASHAAETAQPAANAEPEVSTLEDLMREHGALRRILLMYDHLSGLLSSGKEFPAEVLTQTIDIVRRFVQDYHEYLEEQYLFPRFRKAGKLVDLTKVLLAQHNAGRRLLDQIKSLATAEALKNGGQQKSLAERLRLFARMYRPHAAREDTILFPAFHSIVTAKEYDALGDTFEDKEQELFGKDGFEKVVAQIAEMEQKLGLYELAQFTPSL